jgi:transcriptional regulator with XRE-family HTH domain
VTTGKQPQQPQVGPVGRSLIANVSRLCQARGLSYRRLSAELAKTGTPIPPLGISRLIHAERRVNVDELTGLAQVLDVTPDDLLAPPGTRKPATSHAATRAAKDLTTRIEQLLAASGDPADRELLSRYVDLALRRVQLEVDQLLADREVTGARPR